MVIVQALTIIIIMAMVMIIEAQFGLVMSKLAVVEVT